MKCVKKKIMVDRCLIFLFYGDAKQYQHRNQVRMQANGFCKNRLTKSL